MENQIINSNEEQQTSPIISVELKEAQTEQGASEVTGTSVGQQDKQIERQQEEVDVSLLEKKIIELEKKLSDRTKANKKSEIQSLAERIDSLSKTVDSIVDTFEVKEEHRLPTRTGIGSKGQQVYWNGLEWKNT